MEHGTLAGYGFADERDRTIHLSLLGNPAVASWLNDDVGP